MAGEADAKLRSLKFQREAGPALRFIYPYDDGVFMYSKRVGKPIVVSGLQAFLDLYARGGRDLKQAEFLLSNSIQRRWGRRDSRAAANLYFGVTEGSGAGRRRVRGGGRASDEIHAGTCPGYEGHRFCAGRGGTEGREAVACNQAEGVGVHGGAKRAKFSVRETHTQ